MKIPDAKPSSPMPAQPKVDPLFLQLAAADMHEQGRFNDTEVEPPVQAGQMTDKGFQAVSPQEQNAVNRQARDRGEYYKDSSGGLTHRPGKHQQGGASKGDRLDKAPGS